MGNYISNALGLGEGFDVDIPEPDIFQEGEGVLGSYIGARDEARATVNDTRTDDAIESLGRTPGHRATFRFEEMIAGFQANGEALRNALDLILDMPPGYKTGEDINHALNYVPLGLLVSLLRRRAIERHGVDTIINDFVLSGNIFRLQNVERPEPTEENDDPEFSDVFSRNVIRQEIEEYDFNQFPLRKVLADVPPSILEPGQTLESILIAWAPPAFKVTTNENVLSLNFENYYTQLTKAQGGSDLTFYVFTMGASILRRYQSTVGVGNQEGFRRARSIRSAGLRQVLLDDFINEVSHPDENSRYQVYTKIYVPGGVRNCFLASIRWSYVQSKKEEHSSSLLEKLECAQDSDMLVTEDISIFDEEKCFEKIDIFITNVVKKRADNRQIENVRDYVKKYKNGFPTVEMKELAALFYQDYGILLYLYRIGRSGAWENILDTDDIESLGGSNSSDEGSGSSIMAAASPITRICLFQISDQGEILNIQEEKKKLEEKALLEGLSDGSLGCMTHIIGTHPFPRIFGSNYIKLAIGRVARRKFKEEVNGKIRPRLEDIYSKLVYNPSITYDDIYNLVKHQQFRYSLKETRTLIFDLTTSSSLHEAKRLCFGVSIDQYMSKNKKDFLKRLNDRENPRVWVFAYDLETVDNSLSIQHKVYPPFRKEKPEGMVSADLYDIQESQIPFSAQWIGVNVSDTDNFFRRKIVGGVKPLEYPCYHPKYSEFLTKEAYTCYGQNKLLGECVEEFLCDIAMFVHENGGEQAFLYATNGSKFDAYVILQFQRFEITNILKTSRGILSVTIRVPIFKPALMDTNYDYKNDPNPKVSIRLRDVSLIVPGSLSRLCKGFDVPKEYCKVDFPIQMVNHTNCYREDIMEVCRDYGEKDVFALAFVINRVNALIGNSYWNPCEINSDRPPITQFITCMGMIRKSTKEHFDSLIPQSHQPKAIDIPALRTWLIQAAIGGRVTAYAKTYASSFTNDILQAYNDQNVSELKNLYGLMIKERQCMECLDFTSLYPFTMDSCPLPMGGLHAINVETCEHHIQAMHCNECDRLRRLCPKHRYYYGKNDRDLRPFSIILVKNIRIKASEEYPLRNLCPRKTYSRTNKTDGLLYSLENQENFEARTEGKEILHDPQSYTNIDLYWMRRQGYSFDIIAGFSFSVLMVYNTYIGPAFEKRIEAKKKGNKLLSDFLKLNYNGSYGVTIQQDITESYFVTRIDAQFKFVPPTNSSVRNAIYESSQKHKNREGLACSEELTGEAIYFPNKQSCFQKIKKPHLAEYFSEQSPMQVGAAILAYARHVGNLVLFNIPQTSYTYTDTDSITVGESTIQDDGCLNENIINREDAPMGSLKNDHAEGNGTEPRIFLSLIGTKKVKCHLTLNEEGEVRVFNTFKGLHVSCDINGKKIKPEYAEYITTKTLVDVNLKNRTDAPITVQSWKRDLQHGISIGNHLQVLDTNTYLQDHKGLVTKTTDFGKVEYLVPHGSPCEPDIKVIVNPENSRELMYDKPREALYDPEILKQFVENYYQGSGEEYNPGTEEYKSILDLFNKK